jgi:FlaA1/EpsC-like NDP-sugar epimerase
MLFFLKSLSNSRILLAFIYDILAATFSFWFSIILRYELGNIESTNLERFLSFYIINQVVLTTCFVTNGLYRGMWRFSSTHDLLRVIKASTLGVLISIIISFFLFRLENVPRSIYIIQFFILVVTLGGGRFLYRFIKDQTSMKSVLGGHDIQTQNVLIIGAGRAGEKLIRDINSNQSLKLNVVGLLDDDQRKINAFIHNVKVLGRTSDVSSIVNKINVHKIFIAIPSATKDEVKNILDECKNLDVEVKILPKFDQIISKEVGISLLRNINIEDLLGREQVNLNQENLEEMVSNKTILVTGAGGSIGSEICRQIVKFKPARVVLADYCELFVYQLEMEFKLDHPETTIIPKIIDVRDEEKLENLFSEIKPDIVFHAAAYKHVPLMEQNPTEAITTNVKGTMNLAEVSLRHNVDRFVMISTDKAVNPTNIMGASKRIAEMVITEYAAKSVHTKFISVRFGNVLGSNGSVIPHFRKLIDERRDITVTHPEMTRYFMSIPEASQLVIQAGAMGDGGEIYVLEMGNSVKIVDLATEMIKLAKLELGKDINIVYTGLRPGEKLYEELFSSDEEVHKTSNEKILISKHRDLPLDFEKNLNLLLDNKSSHKQAVLRLIKNLVPELDHAELTPDPDKENIIYS